MKSEEKQKYKKSDKCSVLKFTWLPY